jgi:DNA-directed RNA polymerase specialized sigma24 family protein
MAGADRDPHRSGWKSFLFVVMVKECFANRGCAQALIAGAAALDTRNAMLTVGFCADTVHAMSSDVSSSEAPRMFPHTRWSLVLAARQAWSPESAAALETLCRVYWFPLYAYVRRCGLSPHDAQDLTQEFFRRLLEKRWLNDVDRAKGRLRTFLLVALKNLMRKEWRRAAAQRRGGGHVHVPFDTTVAEGRYAADGHSLSPEDTFDQQWAFALLEVTVNRLRAEFATAGKPEDFETLKPCLMVARGAIDYAAVASLLAKNEGAARVAVHRLRKRFRELYREELAQTLSAEADIEEELRHLAAALGRQ